ANLVLAKEIVTPRDRLRRGIVAVPVETPSDVVVTIAANAITLTPGSLTVEIGEGQQHTLYVHVLHLHDVQEARREIVEFERFASQAVAATEADDHHSKGASP
ncbi:MAG TPA: Na+/H+ antiporter subunit E, partial [Acidimicrobiia bacterium]|nr:Na+/H+ antiporter subunit E [Acidimicrobiia bacterium]